MTALAVPPTVGHTTSAVPRSGQWPTAWPLAVLLLGYPLWWALGVAPLIWATMAVPMTFQLLRRRPVRFPPMFWVWALFLVLNLISSVMLDVNAPGTIAVSHGVGHYLAYFIRTLNYFAVTVVRVYVGNLTEAELPRLRLIRWLSALFVVTVLGGLAGTFKPTFNYSSPLERILPATIAKNDFVQQFIHVSTAQIQAELGYPRPSAPFEYSNAWGNNYSMLLVWFVVGALFYASFQRKIFVVLTLAISFVPVVYSQNRGMWIGLILSVIYLAVRLALRQRYALFGAIVAGAVLVSVAVVLSPLQQVIATRIATPHSNQVRGSLSSDSIKVAATSPIIGYGSTRSTIGSDKSATIGQSPACPRCGNRVIGSTGQIWLLLVAQGFVGAGLYLLFLGQAVIRYWRDKSPIGMAGVLVLLLAIFYSAFYTALVSPLAITFLALGLLWRNAQARAAATGPAIDPGAVPGG